MSKITTKEFGYVKTLTVTVPEKIVEKLREDAMQEHRSLSGQVSYVLSRHYDLLALNG